MKKVEVLMIFGLTIITIPACAGTSTPEIEATTQTAVEVTQPPQSVDTPTDTPTATAISTSTPTSTPSPTSTSTHTATPKPTNTPTNTPTPMDTSTPTATPTPVDTPTPVPTATPSLGIGSTKVRQQDGATMVYVPAGEFLMGSDYTGDGTLSANQSPPHIVYLDAYWIDQTEVTNAQYNQCVTNGVCAGGDASPEWMNYPVTNITWERAQIFCQWTEGRLPTEAEWEKAARGTDGRTYPWGEGLDCSHARYDGEGCSTELLPVGSLPAGASPYGALDMSGNVAEWVADWLDVDYYTVSPKENPPGPEWSQGIIIRGETANVRVIRGNRIYADRPGITNRPQDLTTTSRGWSFPDSGALSIGFRCVQAP